MTITTSLIFLFFLLDVLFQEVDVDSDNLEIDYSIFEEFWPKLAHRVPAFENLKVLT